MHVCRWSKDQAVNYMLNHTALHKSEVENEVDRYITWPGQVYANEFFAIIKFDLLKTESKFNCYNINTFMKKIFYTFYVLRYCDL